MRLHVGRDRRGGDQRHLAGAWIDDYGRIADPLFPRDHRLQVVGVQHRLQRRRRRRLRLGERIQGRVRQVHRVDHQCDGRSQIGAELRHANRIDKLREKRRGIGAWRSRHPGRSPGRIPRAVVSAGVLDAAPVMPGLPRRQADVIVGDVRPGLARQAIGCRPVIGERAPNFRVPNVTPRPQVERPRQGYFEHPSGRGQRRGRVRYGILPQRGMPACDKRHLRPAHGRHGKNLNVVPGAYRKRLQDGGRLGDNDSLPIRCAWDAPAHNPSGRIWVARRRPRNRDARDDGAIFEHQRRVADDQIGRRRDVERIWQVAVRRRVDGGLFAEIPVEHARVGFAQHQVCTERDTPVRLLEYEACLRDFEYLARPAHHWEVEHDGVARLQAIRRQFSLPLDGDLLAPALELDLGYALRRGRALGEGERHLEPGAVATILGQIGVVDHRREVSRLPQIRLGRVESLHTVAHVRRRQARNDVRHGPAIVLGQRDGR